MERDRGGLADVLNERLRTSLFFWQGNPESPQEIHNLKNLIEEVSDRRFGMSFKIKDSILKSSEARRGILPNDLEKFAKHEGDFFVFNLNPRKRPHPEFLLTARMFYGQPHLLLLRRDYGMVGIFRPHEIESFEVRSR